MSFLFFGVSTGKSTDESLNIKIHSNIIDIEKD